MDDHISLCEECGAYLSSHVSHGGSRQRFCSTRCRVRAFRRMRSIPLEMREAHRWVRSVGKRPIRCDGRPASSTDPTTWASYEEVMKSTAGDGWGFMLGSGFACWDFDHVPESEMRGRFDSVSDPVYAEVSVSGHGLHVFVHSSAPSFRRDGVEFYSRSRFIRMTGRRFGR